MSPSYLALRPGRAIQMAAAGFGASSGLAHATHRDLGCSSGHYICTVESSDQAHGNAADAYEDVLGRDAPSTLNESAPSRTLGQDCARPAPAGEASVAVLGYASVNVSGVEYSTQDLRRQVDEITAACERRGLLLMRVAHDRVPPRQRPLERPGLGYALGRIKAGEASGLVVSELSRLARALPELGRVLEWLTDRDVRFIAAVPRIDTGEEAGRLAVQTIIEVSRWERERLVEGTRAGMLAARRKGPASVTDYPELRERIAGMRAAGMTLQAIADQLNVERVPTIRGGAKWRPSSVQAAAGYHRPPARRPLDVRPRDLQSHGPQPEDT
jgi:DNA invertase Pin-like site-specific DNA recombinase